MTSTTTTKTINNLHVRQLFAAHGIPKQLVSDNGPQLTVEEFAAYMKQNNVKHIRCAPNHPSSNGLVERFNQTMKQTLRSSEKDGRSLTQRLYDFLLTKTAPLPTQLRIVPQPPSCSTENCAHTFHYCSQMYISRGSSQTGET